MSVQADRTSGWWDSAVNLLYVIVCFRSRLYLLRSDFGFAVSLRGAVSQDNSTAPQYGQHLPALCSTLVSWCIVKVNNWFPGRLCV